MGGFFFFCFVSVFLGFGGGLFWGCLLVWVFLSFGGFLPGLLWSAFLEAADLSLGLVFFFVVCAGFGGLLVYWLVGWIDFCCMGFSFVFVFVSF